MPAVIAIPASPDGRLTMLPIICRSVHVPRITFRAGWIFMFHNNFLPRYSDRRGHRAKGWRKEIMAGLYDDNFLIIILFIRQGFLQ